MPVVGGLAQVRADSYPALLTAAYTLPAPLLSTDASPVVTIPGMSGANVVTVCLKATKPNAAQSLYMLCGIEEVTGGSNAYTDLCFAGTSYGSAGLAQNTYSSGFTGGGGTTLFDGGATVQITAKFFKSAQTTSFELYVGGSAVAIGSFSGQVNRIFSNRLFIGNTIGYRWPGDIPALKVYLSNLSTTDRLTAEASL